MLFINKIESNGFNLDLITLTSGKVLGIDSEQVALYSSMKDFNEFRTIDRQSIDLSKENTTKEFNDYTIEIQTHGTKFVPNMIGNLSVWLDSSDTTNIFSNINGNFTAKIGDNVALWKNKSNDQSQF